MKWQSLAGDIAVAFSGNIINADALMAEMMARGRAFWRGYNVELISKIILEEADPVAGLTALADKVNGAYSLVVLTRDGIYATRDVYGFRPLILGQRQGQSAVTPESRALQNLDFEVLRDVRPGEIILVNEKGFTTLKELPSNIQGLNAYAYWGQTNELFNALLLLKAGNFNAVRSCQHVEFPEVLDWMDRVGIMSEQDQGGGYRGSLDMGIRREQHIHTGTVLARQTYNNPGVVLLTFGNEHEFPTEPIVRAALAVDPQRILKPISGRFSHSS